MAKIEKSKLVFEIDDILVSRTDTRGGIEAANAAFVRVSEYD